jgi:hypothetical protein
MYAEDAALGPMGYQLILWTFVVLCTIQQKRGVIIWQKILGVFISRRLGRLKGAKLKNSNVTW